MGDGPPSKKPRVGDEGKSLLSNAPKIFDFEPIKIL